MIFWCPAFGPAEHRSEEISGSVPERDAIPPWIGPADQHAALVVYPDCLTPAQRRIGHFDLVTATCQLGDN